MAILLACALLALGGRLVYLQVIQHERLLQLAQGNTVRKFQREPMRGQILDRLGKWQVIKLHQKTQRCPMRAAAKAMIKLLVRAHPE